MSIRGDHSLVSAQASPILAQETIVSDTIAPKTKSVTIRSFFPETWLWRVQESE